MLLFIIHRKTGSLSSISASLFLPSEKPCRKRDCSLFRHSFGAELFLCFLSSFLRVYSFFQLFGNSPSRALGSRNLDSFLGRRVVAFTGFALADFECTKTDKLNLISLYKGLGNNIDYRFNCFSESFFVISAVWATALMSSVLFITKHPPLINSAENPAVVPMD